MAAAPRAASNLEQKLMCQVCHEVFESKPFSLKCLHNYCEACLKKLPRESKDGTKGVSCPVCRQFCNDHDIKYNFILDDIVQGFKHLCVDRILNKIPEDKCGHCGRNDPITALCLVCDNKLCTTCKERHAKLLLGHDVVSTYNKEGFITVSLAKSCSVHPGQPIRAHCIPCQKAICSECKLGAHDTHPTESILQALKMLIPKVKAKLEVIQSKSNNLKHTCNLVDKSTNTIAENHKKILQMAESEMKRRIQRIKDEYKALQDKIYTQPVLKEGMMVKQDLEASASSYESLISWGNTLLDMTQGPGTLYEIQNRLMLRVNSLTKNDTDFRDSREFMSKTNKCMYDFVPAKGQNLLGEFQVQAEKQQQIVSGYPVVPNRPSSNINLHSYPKGNSNKDNAVANQLYGVFKHKHANTQIEVLKGDITKLKVDAIINPANGRLKHGAGLARAIAVAAGEDLVRESDQTIASLGHNILPGDTCTTTGGNLQCRVVIHAVGPIYKDYQSPAECTKVLRRTFESCLNDAFGQQCLTVAIPAISSGIYGVPKDTVAYAAAATITEYLDKNPECGITEIKMIDIDEEMLQLFIREFNKFVNKKRLVVFVILMAEKFLMANKIDFVEQMTQTYDKDISVGLLTKQILPVLVWDRKHKYLSLPDARW